MGGVLSALFGGGHRRGPAGAERMRSREPSGYPGSGGVGDHRRRAMVSKKYSYIPDTYTSLDQVWSIV